MNRRRRLSSAQWLSIGEALQHPLERLRTRRPAALGHRLARMSGELRAHLRMLVGGIVVGDGVDDLAGRHRLLDGVEEVRKRIYS